MRNTEFRALLNAHFGPVRAASVAMDHVFAALGERTPDQAIAAGYDPKTVWLLICDTFDVPTSLRYGLPD